MVSNDIGRQLHDRLTRGESISVAEQAQLKSWYDEQDRIETGELGAGVAKKSNTTLQAQVDAALAQLAAVTKRIQEIAAENEALRQEIASLRRELTQLPQPA